MQREAESAGHLCDEHMAECEITCDRSLGRTRESPPRQGFPSLRGPSGGHHDQRQGPIKIRIPGQAGGGSRV